MTENAIAEIAHTPAARPSTPSEKLTTFMTATRPSTVSGPPRSPNSTAPRNGNVMLRTTTSGVDEDQRGDAPGPRAWRRAADRAQSSHAPTSVMNAAAIEDPARPLAVGHEQQRSDQRPGEDRQAAEQRRRLARQAARLQRVDRADTASEARHRAASGAPRRRRPPGRRRGLRFPCAAERIAGSAAAQGYAARRRIGDCSGGMAGKLARRVARPDGRRDPHPPPPRRRLPRARRRPRAAAARQRSVPRAVGALAAAITLALAAPLAWAAAGAGPPAGRSAGRDADRQGRARRRARRR